MRTTTAATKVNGSAAIEGRRTAEARRRDPNPDARMRRPATSAADGVACTDRRVVRRPACSRRTTPAFRLVDLFVVVVAVVQALFSVSPALAQRPPQAVEVNAGAEAVPDELREVGFDQRLGGELPLDLAFRDEVGRTVRLGELFERGRPVVIAPVYFRCPMLCDLTMSGLAASLKPLAFSAGREFEVVAFSFDPGEGPEDAAAARRRYLPRYDRPGAEDGWHFLTGDAEAIAALTGAIGFRYVYDAERDEYAHAAGVVVATADGRIARYFFGTDHPPKDLKLGLIEASERRIGSAIDRLLLYCYHYDPELGRYSAATMSLVRAGGIATLVLLGGFVGIMLGRERRRAAARARAGAPAGGGSA